MMFEAEQTLKKLVAWSIVYGSPPGIWIWWSFYRLFISARQCMPQGRQCHLCPQPSVRGGRLFTSAHLAYIVESIFPRPQTPGYHAMIRISWCAGLCRGACRRARRLCPMRRNAIGGHPGRERWKTVVRLVSKCPTSRESHCLTHSRACELAQTAPSDTVIEVVFVISG